MIQITLEDLLRWTNGKILNPSSLNDVQNSNYKQIKFNGIGTDTRKDLSGKIFVALKGDQFDAHDFLAQAIAQKAAALLVHRLDLKTDLQKVAIPIVEVKDTLLGFQELAKKYRQTLKTKLIGITGSNGKTSTKEFAAAILNDHFSLHFNEGSLNNHWGVPMNLLGIDPATEVGLVEIGMNHAGEITELVGISKPDIVICTMVGKAHIEHFGSIEKIAEAKAEIYLAAPSAKMIFNIDNPFTLKMYQKYKEIKPPAELITFSGQHKDADIFFKINKMSLSEISFEGAIQGIPGQQTAMIFGQQNLTNLLAAAAIAVACQLSPQKIWKSLGQCKTTWGRNQLLSLKNGAQLLFDAYNANPDSMSALLENLKLLQHESMIGVFGQMKELGTQSAELHQELGQQVGAIPFKKIFFIGDDHEFFLQGLAKAGREKEIFLAKDLNVELQTQFERSVGAKDLVAMKASRGTRLERFLSESLLDLNTFKK